ncbi:MAG: DUF2726 domain-containing protein [Leptolyngbya sp.]|nr:DUF2726 domain-containing protein [Leptolyngbya sp.]
MTGLWVILGIALAVGLGSLLLQGQKRGRPAASAPRPAPDHSPATAAAQDYRYTRQPYLMTRAELAFYRVLVQVVGQRGMVFAKVRVADVIVPRETDDRKQWRGAFNKISAKHLDFILCHPKTLEILGAIELDDRSHNRRDRQERDAFLEEAMASAEVPLVRVPVQATYSVKDLTEQVQGLLPRPATPKPRPRPQRPQSP